MNHKRENLENHGLEVMRVCLFSDSTASRSMELGMSPPTTLVSEKPVYTVEQANSNMHYSPLTLLKIMRPSLPLTQKPDLMLN